MTGSRLRGLRARRHPSPRGQSGPHSPRPQPAMGRRRAQGERVEATTFFIGGLYLDHVTLGGVLSEAQAEIAFISSHPWSPGQERRPESPLHSHRNANKEAHL